MTWAIIRIYTSKCAQMNPQQLPKTSQFYSRCHTRDHRKNLRGWVPPPFGSPKVKCNCLRCCDSFAFVQNCFLLSQGYNKHDLWTDEEKSYRTKAWCSGKCSLN